MGKLYNYMNESLKQMKSEANDLKKQLQTLPDGNLLLRKKSSPDGNVKKVIATIITTKEIYESSARLKMMRIYCLIL